MYIIYWGNMGLSTLMSRIVNCMNVSSMTVNSIILREGTELICSKKFKQKFRNLMWN